MAVTYRMMPHGSEFILNHDAGGTVGVYKTKAEARQGMADCKRDDLMLKTAGAPGGKSGQRIDASASH